MLSNQWLGQTYTLASSGFLEARNTVKHLSTVDIVIGKEEDPSNTTTPDHTVKVGCWGTCNIQCK